VKARQRTQARVLIAFGAVVAVASVIAFVPWNGSDNKPTPQPSPTVGKLLDANGTALATLLTNARKHTFHARYAVQGDPAVIGGTLGLEWWNTPDHSRLDTTRTQGGKVVKTASIVNDDQGASCQKDGSSAWTCKQIDVPAAGDPGGIVANLTGQLSGRAVTQHADTVQGHHALCFNVAGGTEPIDVCTNSDGVLLRNASAKTKFEISSLDTKVPDSIFKAPAAVLR
jgi:hypothetical protein